MPVPVPEYDIEVSNFRIRTRAATTSLKLVPNSGQTAPLITAVNYDATENFPTGYTTWGGVGHAGPIAAIKSTSGAPADANFTGATPAIAAPPVGTLIYNTNSHKLYVVDAAGSYLSSVAFT